MIFSEGILAMERDHIFSAALQTIQQKTFYQMYWRTFEVIHAQTDELKERTFKLRYDVFCRENQFEIPGGPECSPEEIERDTYDAKAFHFLLVHRDSGDDAGTVRVLLPDEAHLEKSFPLQKVCDHPLLTIDNKVLRLAELSRLCMAKRFRRRPLDGKILPSYYETEAEDAGKGLGRFFRRRIPYAPLGLLKVAFETALEFNIPDMVTAMDPTHFRTMKRIGFSYRVLGPRIDYHGGQQPVVFNIKHVLDNMAVENPECWEIVGDQGRLHKKANTIAQNEWHDSVFDDNCREMIMKKLI